MSGDGACEGVQGDNAISPPSPESATTPPLISRAPTPATPSTAPSVSQDRSQAPSSAVGVDLAEISDVKQKRILRVTYEEVYGDQGVGLILPVDECLESELGLVQARELGLLPACGTTGTPYAEEEDKEGQATGSKQEGGDRPKDAVVEVRDADANAVLSGSRHSQLTVATSISASSPELKPTSSHTSNESDECLQAHLFSGEVDSATAQAGPVRALVTAQDIKTNTIIRVGYDRGGKWWDLGFALPLDLHPPSFDSHGFATPQLYPESPRTSHAPSLRLSSAPVAGGSQSAVWATYLKLPTSEEDVPVLAKLSGDELGAYEQLVRERKNYALIGGGLEGVTPVLVGAYVFDPESCPLGRPAGLLLLTDEGDPLSTFDGLSVAHRLSIESLYLRLHDAGLCQRDLVPGNVVYRLDDQGKFVFRLLDLGRAAPTDHGIDNCRYLARLRLRLEGGWSGRTSEA
ncbi:hypothetical protein NBRC10512_001903 [Rhodotorula toruloides]|uniref:RHTO0S02e05930g1_1 n=2 Tax=Rhodotorula toruloides TaxID=5286 RepID=A0A061APQ5_RHOTO|nr:uncharacterized protein RHTO_01108 [Rhodotorula toruloides NP11]EMS21894.1 hypothetical protein RHTO_01108 [Rhodotorula toruloides NP11]CDR36712.1 RHTO0S02e05930g1_1 [Rhodotorula toruloides]